LYLEIIFQFADSLKLMFQRKIKMNNELTIDKSWLKRNRNWFLPTFIVLFLLLIGLILSSNIQGNVSDIVQAYTDNSLYEKAIEKANTNKRVSEIIGKIEPIDKLAILEGNVTYSNNNKTVELTVRVKGNKGKGKMDIIANKKEKEWVFKKINIRIKEPKEEIQIVKDTVL
jgi:hypothetical protein